MKFVLGLIISVICVLALAENNRENSMKFGMQAVLTASEGNGDQLADIMLSASQVVSKLEGCELYLVQQSLTDENQILITELWSSKENHQASLKNEDVLSLITKAKPIIVAMDGKPAKFIGAHGVVQQ